MKGSKRSLQSVYSLCVHWDGRFGLCHFHFTSSFRHTALLAHPSVPPIVYAPILLPPEEHGEEDVTVDVLLGVARPRSASSISSVRPLLGVVAAGEAVAVVGTP